MQGFQEKGLVRVSFFNGEVAKAIVSTEMIGGRLKNVTSTFDLHSNSCSTASGVYETKLSIYQASPQALCF